MAERDFMQTGRGQPNNLTGIHICSTCGRMIDPNNSMQYFGMPGNQITMNSGEIKNSDNASNTHCKEGLKKAPLQRKFCKSSCTPVRTFIEKEKEVKKLMSYLSTALANTEKSEADKDDVHDTDSYSAGCLANAKFQPKQKKKCLQRKKKVKVGKTKISKVAALQRKPCMLDSTYAHVHAFLERQKEVKKLMEESSTTDGKNSKIEIDSSSHDTITAVKFQRKPKKKVSMYSKIAKVGKKRLAKEAQLRKKSWMLNSTNANIRAFFKRQKEVKKLMQQSSTPNTLENPVSRNSEVDIDCRLHDHIRNAKLKQVQNKICLKRNKVGKKYRMKLSGLQARQKGKAKKKIGRQKKEMYTDNESCNSSIPAKRKKEVELKEQQRKAMVISPQKKKNISEAFRYVIETNSPLPFGVYLISVDNKKSEKCSVAESDSSENDSSKNDSSENDSSESDSNGSPSDDYQASTALCQQNRKRRANYKDFVQKYKNKNPNKFRYKHRRC